MSKIFTKSLIITLVVSLALAAILTACGNSMSTQVDQPLSAIPTVTPLPEGAEPGPSPTPTVTPLPPTATPLPPTSTPKPTAKPAPAPKDKQDEQGDDNGKGGKGKGKKGGDD